MNTTENVIVTYYNSNEVSYESNFNSYTELSGSCVTVTSAIEDLYNQLEQTYIDFNESDFPSEQDYIIYPTNLDFYKVVKQHKEEIKSLIDKVKDLENTRICDLSVTGCDINYQGIVDNCGNTPETFTELINLILENIDNE